MAQGPLQLAIEGPIVCKEFEVLQINLLYGLGGCLTYPRRLWSVKPQAADAARCSAPSLLVQAFKACAHVHTRTHGNNSHQHQLITQLRKHKCLTLISFISAS